MATVERFGFESILKDFRVILHKCFEAEDASHLLKAFNESPVLENNKKTAMDQVFRDVLLQLLENDQSCLERYITFCIECCRKQVVTPTMPVVLLGDIFDAMTLDRCEKMFAFVENEVNVWKEDLFFIACKNNLLRMCNDLLRRLSRSQNTIFCGRILLFLAKFFPFSERSGLNIVSEFNLDNVTELGADDGVSLKDALSEDDEKDEGNKSKLVIDYNLYCKFWSLQDYFRNPNMCYNKVHWKTFSTYASSVLSAFGSHKLEVVQLKNDKGTKRSFSQSMATDQEEESGKGNSEDKSNYFAKFLTNQKLLELELSDANFRRCVLVQFLILFQYLNASVKSKSESFELKSDQSEWVKATVDLVYSLIGETPPNGKMFGVCVKHALQREEYWNNWKNEGCPEFRKMKSSTSTGQGEGVISEESRKMLKARRKRLLGDIIKEYEGQGKFYLGNSELTKLWNLCPNNLEACKTKERDFLPSLESYLSEAMAQCESGVTGASRVVSDGSWGWRALRLLARRSPHFFMYSNPINSLPDYLELMVKKVIKDMPSTEDVKETKQDLPDEENSEEQMEADLMKGGDPDDVEQVPEASKDEDGEEDGVKKSAPPKPITEQQMSALCEKLQGDNWKKLATKLGFKPDEIEFFHTSFQTDTERANKMLLIWFDDDEDASVDNLAYILEGLKMLEAAETLKEPESNSS